MAMTAQGDRDSLRDVARRVVETHSPVAAARRLADEPIGFDAELWDRFAHLGWTGLAVDEAHGGSGGSFADVVVVLEEMGRQVVASPFLSQVALGIEALKLAGDDALRQVDLAALAEGRSRVTLAQSGLAGLTDGGGSRVVATATRRGWVLRGSAEFVLDAQSADFVVVAASLDEDPTATALFLVPTDVPGVEVTGQPTADITRRLGAIVFDGAAITSTLDGPGDVDSLVDALVVRASIALAADSLGGTARVMELSAGYAKERVQFGRPIGSFQAIKHKCADMVLLAEASRAALEYAVEALSGVSGVDPRVAASVAKSYCCDAYVRVAGDAVQIHGGIGFTWEHDVHLYLKRALLNAGLFGSSRWHRERIATLAVFAGADGAAAREDWQ